MMVGSAVIDAGGLPDPDRPRAPGNRDRPERRIPTPLNPLGIMGAGESGINAVGAAIAAAIDNAIGIPGAITQLPVTPQQLKAILERRG